MQYFSSVLCLCIWLRLFSHPGPYFVESQYTHLVIALFLLLTVTFLTFAILGASSVVLDAVVFFFAVFGFAVLGFAVFALAALGFAAFGLAVLGFAVFGFVVFVVAMKYSFNYIIGKTVQKNQLKS
jgi:hypothetical protein